MAQKGGERIVIEHTKKAAAYLRYLKNRGALTYRQIEETSGVSDSTAQAYFAGRVQTMRQETFQALVSAMGGNMEEFELWQPAVVAEPSEVKEGEDMMQMKEIIDALREAFNSATLHMESTYNKSFDQLKQQHQHEVERLQQDYSRAVFRQRNEKYVLFLILICVAVYAVFAFLHYDLADPSSGLTSIF